MKAKLDQIRLNIGDNSKKREDSEEARKYYEVSTHRGNQELDADQETIEEDLIDIVNRKKMERVKDMPRQSIELIKGFAKEKSPIAISKQTTEDLPNIKSRDETQHRDSDIAVDENIK